MVCQLASRGRLVGALIGLVASVSPAVAATEPTAPGSTETAVSTPTPTATQAVSSSTPTETAIVTPTPRIVSLSVGSAIGEAGDAVNVVVSVGTSGLIIGAIENDLTFDPQVLDLNSAACRLARMANNPFIASLPQPGTVHVIVAASFDGKPIVDGPLYTCTFRIVPSAPSGTYTVAIGNACAAHDPSLRYVVVSHDGSVTVSLSVRTCDGDCNADRSVTVDELIVGVNIALGSAPITTCLQFDRNDDGAVTIDELIDTVNRALLGCAQVSEG